jgi:hypothetical protein
MYTHTWMGLERHCCIHALPKSTQGLRLYDVACRWRKDECGLSLPYASRERERGRRRRVIRSGGGRAELS